MNWNCEGHIITDDIINYVKNILKVDFPDDFLSSIKKYDGCYPNPNVITINGSYEVVNNLVSFCKDDESFIVNIFKETEYLQDLKLIPIAEDPFGNLFCYDFMDDKSKIVFWEHENFNTKKFICDSFNELIQMLHN